jgi:hypothetical protein
MRQVLVIAGLASLVASAAAQRIMQDYATSYTGEWAVNGVCQRGNTFIFAKTWIERASEDICYIDRIDNREHDVAVKATCWHEGTKVGTPTYRMRLAGDGRMVLDGGEPAKRCGGVPDELIEAYGPPVIGPRP